MSRPPMHRCVRCGADVHIRGAACRDCRAVDPATCQVLATVPTRRKAAA